MNFIHRFLMVSVMMVLSIVVRAQQGLDRVAFYKALSSEEIVLLDAQLNSFKNNKSLKGYEAALLMRKAGLVSAISQKYSLFKNGSKQLEESIKLQPANTELRFLRLMIQEQAPRILNYRGSIEEDVQIVIKGYKDFPKETQHAIVGYCKKSTELNIKDLKKE